MSFFFLSFTEHFFSISHFFFPPAFLLSDIFIPSVSVQVWSQAFLYCPVLHPSSLSTSISAVLCSPLLFCPSLTSATFSFFFFFFAYVVWVSPIHLYTHIFSNWCVLKYASVALGPACSMHLLITYWKFSWYAASVGCLLFPFAIRGVMGIWAYIQHVISVHALSASYSKSFCKAEFILFPFVLFFPFYLLFLERVSIVKTQRKLSWVDFLVASNCHTKFAVKIETFHLYMCSWSFCAQLQPSS